MRKSIFLIVAVTAFFLTPAVNAQQSGEAKKALVVYYSRSGNTLEVAKQIQKAIEGDIFEIVPAEAYPEDYQKCIERAKEEIQSEMRPALKAKPEKLKEYDVIFVGSPNWWSTIAPPVAAFLSENDLAGKTIVPFVTHGTGGRANCFADMEKLCPESAFLEGFSIKGENAKQAKDDIDKWLKEIGVTK